MTNSIKFFFANIGRVFRKHCVYSRFQFPPCLLLKIFRYFRLYFEWFDHQFPSIIGSNWIWSVRKIIRKIDEENRIGLTCVLWHFSLAVDEMTWFSFETRIVFKIWNCVKLTDLFKFSYYIHSNICIWNLTIKYKSYFQHAKSTIFPLPVKTILNSFWPKWIYLFTIWLQAKLLLHWHQSTNTNASFPPQNFTGISSVPIW